MPKQNQTKQVAEVAKSLKLEKVGWIFSHPARQNHRVKYAGENGDGTDDEYLDSDEEDEEYRFTAFELLETAEQQMEACGGDLEKVR